MEIKVPLLILADGAQLAGGKLNIWGGGWNELTPNSFPFPHRLAVAASLEMPQEPTGTTHRVEFTVRNPATGDVLHSTRAEVKRGPQMPDPDLPVRTQFVLDLILQFQEAGLYEAVVTVDGERLRAEPFRIRDMSKPVGAAGPASAGRRKRTKRT